MSSATHPTDLMRSSKEKFTLGQARLRRGLVELTLLCLYGSLEDGLRAYLLLHGRAVARGDWPEMIALLRGDEDLPLTLEEADQLQRIYTLWNRIAIGEAVTLTEESVAGYQHLASVLLARYGVLVVVPETRTHAPSAYTAVPTPLNANHWWRQLRSPVMVLLAAAVVLGLGALTFISVNQSFALRGGISFDTVLTPAPADTEGRSTPITTERYVLAPGRVAYVRADLDEDLALRARPGNADDNPVRLYLTPNTAVQIIDGPVERGNQDWWQVRAFNQQGWCRGAALEVR